jgi:hypothetical protein
MTSDAEHRPPEPWVTKRQLADHLGVTPRGIELQHPLGRPHLSTGGMSRYRISEVETRFTAVKLCYHATMAKNLTVRLDDELASDTEALARAEGKSLNETVKHALAEAVQRRRDDPEFKARIRRIIEEDRELLERLAK